MPGVLLEVELALELRDMLDEYLQRPKRTPTHAPRRAASGANRQVYVKVTGKPGASQGYPPTAPPFPNWQPGKVEHFWFWLPEVGTGNAIQYWEEFEVGAGECWVVPSQSPPAGALFDIGARYPALCMGFHTDNRLVYTAKRSDKIRGTMKTKLVYGGTATMTTVQGVDLSVVTWLLSAGQSIAVGIQVEAHFDPSDGKWYVDGAQCAGGGSEPPPPPPGSWNCVDGQCVDPGDGTGTYSTLASCQANCQAPGSSWNCAFGQCFDPGNGTGFYATLAECQANCEAEPCTGQCHWLSDGTQWILTGNDPPCSPGCRCAPPVFGGEPAGTTLDLPCAFIT